MYTSTKAGQSFDVNNRAVLAAKNIGIAHEGLKKFAAVMNMAPPMNQSAYKQTETKIKEAAELVAEKSMVPAATAAKKHYDENDDGMVDIAVSGDGTWRKRGYTSLYGVVAALSVVTGKVLDVEVMSKECRVCAVNKTKVGTTEYDV